MRRHRAAATLRLVESLGTPDEPRVAEELAVLLLVLVRLGVPVGAVRALGLSRR